MLFKILYIYSYIYNGNDNNNERDTEVSQMTCLESVSQFHVIQSLLLSVILNNTSYYTGSLLLTHC